MKRGKVTMEKLLPLTNTACGHLLYPTHSLGRLFCSAENKMPLVAQNPKDRVILGLMTFGAPEPLLHTIAADHLR